jgi:hypothetical protein
MTDALSIAIGGLHTASLKASEAASQLADIVVPVPPPAPPPPNSTTNTDPAVINDTGKKQEPDALKAVTDFQEAARAYEAHVKLVQDLSNAQHQIVEALGWVPPPSKTSHTAPHSS